MSTNKEEEPQTQFVYSSQPANEIFVAAHRPIDFSKPGNFPSCVFLPISEEFSLITTWVIKLFSLLSKNSFDCGDLSLRNTSNFEKIIT